MIHNAKYLVILFTGIILAAALDRELVKFYEITDKVQQKIGPPQPLDHRRYVNVFTNHPQVGEVIKSAYEGTRGNNGTGIPLSALRVKTTFNGTPSASNVSNLQSESPPSSSDDDPGIISTLPLPSALVRQVAGKPRVAKSIGSTKSHRDSFFAVDAEQHVERFFNGSFKLNNTKTLGDGVRIRGNFTVVKTRLAVPKGSLKGLQDLQESLAGSAESPMEQKTETQNQITTTPSSNSNTFDHNRILTDPKNDWTSVDGPKDLATQEKDVSYEDNDYYITFQTKSKQLKSQEEAQAVSYEDASLEKSTRLPRSSSESVLSRPAQGNSYYESDVQSEYGVIIPQKSSEDYTQATQSTLQRAGVPPQGEQSETRGLSDWIQKIPKNFLSAENGSYVGGVANRVHHLLKSYMPKLYQTKYHHEDVHQESKKSFSHKQNKIADALFPNRFLSLFTIVQFPNSQCLASSGLGNYDGVCYHPAECADLNGTAMGRCANGYGVCCAFRNTCGGLSSRNCTYFESPGYPNYFPGTGGTLPPFPSMNVTGVDPRMNVSNTAPIPRQLPTLPSLSCGFQVYKISPLVQQMRIDFIDFELRGPTNGSCVNERLVISGQNVNNPVPMICGYNTGQHIYVDVSNMTGPLQLAIQAATMEQRRFKIKICQLIQVPNSMNCLQYYTGVTGVLTSFNYDQASALNRSTPGYFNNLNYAICIRKEMGYCTVTYTNIQNGVENLFQLSNLDAGLPIIPPGQAGAEIFNCPDDFIAVNGIRLCGDKLNDGSVIVDFKKNAPVTDNSAGPIVLPVRTNGATVGRGFKLFYTQNKCTT